MRPDERPEPFAQGEEVGQGLTGMEQVGETVDHRLASELREIENVLMGEDAGHDAVGERGKHTRGVGHRLAHAQLDLVVVQDHGEAAELEHADLEGHPGAGGGLLEDHGERLAEERLFEEAGVRLHLFREGEDLVDVFPRVVFEGDEVFRFHGSSFGPSIGRRSVSCL